MLLQFRFKNYGPFKDEAVFDMRAIKAYKEHPYNLYNEDEKNSFLKVAAIYGGNASGKSNFVDAYGAFLRIVRESFSQKDKETKTVLSKQYDPFLFDDDSANGNTEFEAVYHLDGYEYRYGFIYNQNRIEYEWLYRKSLVKNRQVKIIERTPDAISLGPLVKTACEKYISEIDNDVLALSFYSSLKLRNSVFKDALRCVLGILPLKLVGDEVVDYLLEFYFLHEFKDENKEELITFLEAIDIGIKDILVEKNNNNVSVYTYHLGKNKKLYRVPIDIESDGTKKAIAVYSFAKFAILGGQGLIVDELNSQLHPLLLKYIVDLFNESKTAGQLIYTTHDTTLLDKQYMRRDQIWFVNKNTEGESSLYSLAEFKVRNDASFEKEYLGGVFGAIPILKEFSFQEG